MKIDLKKLISSAESYVNIAKQPAALLGIDIGGASLKIVAVKSGNPHAATFAVSFDLPNVRRDDFIQEALATLLRTHPDLPKDAVVLISDESTVYRRVELPHMPEKEIRDALVWKERDTISLPIDKALLSFEVIGGFERDDGAKMMEILFVALMRDAAVRTLDAVKAAGLSVARFTVAPFALENIMRLRADALQGKLTMLAHMGHHTTEYSFFDSGKLIFVRSVPVGAEAITDAITGAEDPYEDGVVFAREEAERIKRQLGIAYDEVALERGGSSMQMVSKMRPALEQLLREAKRSLDYFIHEYGAGKGGVDVVLSGGGALLKNIVRYLGEELHLPVSMIDMSGCIVNESDKKDLLSDPSFAPVIGAVSGQSTRFDLLPHEYRTERIEFIETVSLRLIAFILTVVLGVSFLFVHMRVKGYETQLASSPLQRNVIDYVKTLNERVTGREALLAKVSSDEIDAERIMREISLIIPGDTVLSSLSISRDRGLMMQGLCYCSRPVAQQVLANFTEAIERSGSFKDAQVISLENAGSEGQDISSFEITSSWE